MRVVGSILLALLAAAVATSPGSAQRARVGLLAGYSESSARFDYGDGLTDHADAPRAGRTAGAYLLLPLGRRFEFRLETLYAPRGYRRANPSLDFDYLEFPLLIRFRGSDRITPILFGGVAPAYRLSCKVRFDAGAGIEVGGCSDVEPFGKSSEIRSYDVSGVVGAGVAATVWGGELEIDGRYTYGFTDVSATADRVSNRAAAVSVSFGVPLF